MERNGGIDQLASEVSQALERALLIEPSQSRITRHIGGEDRGKLSWCAHRSNALRLETTIELTNNGSASQALFPPSSEQRQVLVKRDARGKIQEMLVGSRQWKKRHCAIVGR